MNSSTKQGQRPKLQLRVVSQSAEVERPRRNDRKGGLPAAELALSGTPSAAGNARRPGSAQPPAPLARRERMPAKIVVRLDGRIHSCSDAACELLGCNPDELAARPAREVFPALRLGAEAPGYNVAFFAFWHPGTAWRALDALASDGRTIPLEATVKAVRARTGREFLVVLRRRRLRDGCDAERCLAAAERRGEAAAIADLRGVITAVNAAFEARLGYRREEVVGSNLHALSADWQADAHFAEFVARIRRQRRVLRTCAYRLHDGHLACIEEHARPFVDGCGKVTGYVLTLHAAATGNPPHPRPPVLSLVRGADAAS